MGSSSSENFNLNRYSTLATLAAGQTADVTFVLTGRLESPAEYKLMVEHFPGAVPDTLSLNITRSDGSVIAGSTVLVESGEVQLPVLSARAPN